jgi:hypothetical protein
VLFCLITVLPEKAATLEAIQASQAVWQSLDLQIGWV